MIKRFLFFFFIHLCLGSNAQIGGSNTYEFINLETPARVAALGGSQIAVRDDDLSLGAFNPALLNESMHNQMIFSYINFFANTKYGFASYAYHIDSVLTFSVTTQFVDYGTFLETNEIGIELGEFTAGEYAINLGAGYEIDTTFFVGGNVKWINSNLYLFNSSALAVDLSGTYLSKNKSFTTSLMARNIGRPLKKYYESSEERLPFEIQFGISKKLKHAPLRLSMVAENLQQWDLTFIDPNQEPETDPLTGKKKSISPPTFLDKLMRHMVLGAEVLITKNFNFRFGYNYRRRRELSITEKSGTVGISWGFGLRISKFHISYGRVTYHLAGPSNHLTIMTRLGDFKRKQ